MYVIVADKDCHETIYSENRGTSGRVHCSSREMCWTIGLWQWTQQLVLTKILLRDEILPRKIIVFVWSTLTYRAMAMKVIPHAANVRQVPDFNFCENPSILRPDIRANVQWCNVHWPYLPSVGKLARCVVNVSRFSDMYCDETPTTAIRNTGEYVHFLWAE